MYTVYLFLPKNEFNIAYIYMYIYEILYNIPCKATVWNNVNLSVKHLRLIKFENYSRLYVFHDA